MQISYNKSMYSKQALLKAAYHFTDDYYIHLDADETHYLVNIRSKDGSEDPKELKGLFSNEILVQSTREAVLNQTMDIRKMVLGRAIASTIIDEQETRDFTAKQGSETERTDLFNDWYDKTK